MNIVDKYREKQEYNKAIDILKLSVIAFPNSWFVTSVLADVYLDAGNNEKAIENYRKSLSIEPKNTWAIEKLKTLGD